MDTDIFTGGPAQNCAYEDTIPQPSVSGTGEILTPIGTKPDGELFFQDISQIPHFLVCGFSGAGKTSFVQTVTTYSAAHYPPEEIRFLIYDSKFIDYNSFNALPHLLIPETGVGEVVADVGVLRQEITVLFELARSELTPAGPLDPLIRSEPEPVERPGEQRLKPGVGVFDNLIDEIFERGADAEGVPEEGGVAAEDYPAVLLPADEPVGAAADQHPVAAVVVVETLAVERAVIGVVEVARHRRHAERR